MAPPPSHPAGVHQDQSLPKTLNPNPTTWLSCNSSHHAHRTGRTCPISDPSKSQAAFLTPSPSWYLVGLVPAFFQADVSQAVQLLQGHEVDTALDTPLVDL